MTYLSQVEDSLAAEDPLIDVGDNKDIKYSRYEEGTGFVVISDTRNSFCELNRHLMLWNVAHIWNKGSRFVYDCYSHWGKVLVCKKPGKPAIIIHSKDGLYEGESSQ